MRGERYLPACPRPEIIRLIKDAPELSYKQTLAMYGNEKLMRNLVPAEKALWGCNDRFFLLVNLLGRKDLLHSWLYDRCRMVEAQPYGCLDLWAREHYKSTLITFAGSIQELVCDPEVTIGIFAFSKEVARPFLSQIKYELETNAGLKAIYADVLWANPVGEAPSWSVENGITVKRKSNPKECTVEAHGLIDAMPTGRHFRIRKYDDVVTERSVSNEDQVKKTTERWELSDNLGAGENLACATGTRYSFNDTYGVMIEREVFKVRLHPATHNGRLDGEPVLWSREKWEEKKKVQRSTLAAQLLQNPLAGQENTFEPGWLRSYWLRPGTVNVYIICDPSLGKPSAKGRTSDRTAIVVIGVDSGGNKYLLDGHRHRMRLSERWQALKMLYVKWTAAEGVQHVEVGYERYGMQSDIEHFEEMMRMEKSVSFPIREIAWPREGDHSKKARVQRLEPDFRDDAFYLPAKVWHPDHGNCTWEVDDSGKIAYKGLVDQNGRPFETREERKAKLAGEAFRLIRPVKRKDEDGNAYDLTRAFFEEFLFFPFSPRDDLIDAVSRIYDMEPERPALFEQEAAKIPVYAD